MYSRMYIYIYITYYTYTWTYAYISIYIYTYAHTFMIYMCIFIHIHIYIYIIYIYIGRNPNQSRSVPWKGKNHRHTKFTGISWGSKPLVYCWGVTYTTLFKSKTKKISQLKSLAVPQLLRLFVNLFFYLNSKLTWWPSPVNIRKGNDQSFYCSIWNFYHVFIPFARHTLLAKDAMWRWWPVPLSLDKGGLFGWEIGSKHISKKDTL